MRPELTVIADDFTGALDTGVKFAAQGFQTMMIPFGRTVQSSSQVVVHDIQSRHLEPENAKRRVMSVAAGADRIYKKTDSTLRGNVGAELEGLSEAADGEDIAFVPAYPAIGRTARGGVLYVDGIPVAETMYGSDATEPVMASDIAALIGLQSELHIVTVSTTASLQATSDPRPTVFAFDASTDDDLARIAEFLTDRGSFRLIAGCAGFATHLPHVFGITPNGPTPTQAASKAPELLVCGSVNPRSMRQAENAIANGWNDIVVAPEVLFGTNEGTDHECKGINGRCRSGEHMDRGVVARALRGDKAGYPFLLRSVRSRKDIQKNDLYAQRMGVAKPDVSQRVADRLGSIAAAIIGDAGLTSVLVFGGDTAAAVCAHLAVDAVYPAWEPFPGVILSRAQSDLGEMTLWTKAGGFGHDTVVNDIISVCGREGK